MKFIIFDIDGTLANTKKVEDKCFMTAFEKTFRIDIWNEKWEDLKHVTDWGITEEIIQREWKRNPTADEYKLMISNFISELEREKEKDPSQFAEVPGASDFFCDLMKQEGIQLGIATGAWEESAKLKLAAIGIELEGVCFSNSNDHKSREAITQEVIARLNNSYNQEPEKIIYFGDGQWDYKTCQNLGIEFIGIDIENDGKLSALGARSVFQNYLNKELLMNVINK